MAKRTCSINGCGKQAMARGWCPMHYQRWRHWGDPLLGARVLGPRVCVVTDCEGAVFGRGWCNMHWQRWYKTGTVEPRPSLSTHERFWAKVQRGDVDECWLWTGKFTHGYGSFLDPPSGEAMREHRAHRWLYERAVSPVPAGLVLDHLCRVLPCVNPWHLEPVTIVENTLRSPLHPRNLRERRLLLARSA